MPHAYINGYNMYYTDKGKGTAIIFIHPPVLTSLNFTYQIDHLSKYFRTIAFDIRGHGHSEPSEQEVTYPLIVEDIKKLMDELQIEKAFLCGYSTGGSVMLEFFLAYPERALGGVVICGMSQVSDRKLKQMISLGRLFSHYGMIHTIALSVSWAQATTKLSHLSLIRLLFKDAKRTNAKNAEQYYQYSMHYNCTSQLSDINQPMLLVYGEKDKTFHPYARVLQERLPNSRLVIFKDMKHQVPTKAADKLNDHIYEFIYLCQHNEFPFT
ncbi:alpha/beta fold hydrolase [Bacillus horti]|uniref:Pimeloyl-ACP methyl ester carboxylesterase n=1 Tax=Caldalkalibacillus horti TaxID=77523 RepID=A0ABT9VWG0_9BACI|nr:alpha/beta hydrolase [Bacillus horti]MDQ0165328.1 pimeloyl-ACP methyl ester carboxylesterase [Bacillus horti]